MCVVLKNPLLCRGGICYVGRGWKDNPEEPSWYLNFTNRPSRDANRFYYIDNNEEHEPDCIADFTKKIEIEQFPSGVFAIVVLEFLPVDCFNQGKHTIANAKLIAKDGGLIMVMSGQSATEAAAQRMRESGLQNVRVVRRVTAEIYSEKGVQMARDKNAMLTFRLEPENYRKAFGEQRWEEAEELGADINEEYWIALGRT